MASQTYVDSVTLTAAAEFNKFDTAAYAALSSVAGTNTITATGPANLTLVATNPVLWFTPAATNTGATTLNVTPSGGAALGAKNIFCGGAACVGGEIVSGVPCAVVYDGTQYNLIGPSRKVTTIVSSTSLPSANSVSITDIPQSFAYLVLVVTGASFDTAARAVYLQCSTDNGSSFDTTASNYALSGVVNGSATAGSVAAVVTSGATQAAAETTTFQTIISGYQSGMYTQAKADGKYASSLVFELSGLYLSTSAVNAIRLIMNDTGNFDAGTYALYGIR